MAIRNGTPDDDILYGTTGNDTIKGFAGNDIIYGRGGTDTIDGGDGDDVVFLSDFANQYSINNSSGGSGFDTIFLGGSISFFDSLDFTYADNRSFEKVVGNNADNRIFSDLATVDVYLFGRGGHDHLVGGLGNDTLIGGDGDDELVGNEGTDFLNGGNGIDKLFGGKGRDVMTGGDGADRFVFLQFDLIGGGMTPTTCDRITDFDRTEKDRILLGAVDANTTNGVQPNDTFTFIADAAFSGTAGELRYQHIGANTFVMGDTDGINGADFWIRLDGLHTLTAGDFVL